MHRAVKGEEVGIPTIRFGKDAVSLGITLAPRLIGLLLRIGAKHDHVAVGLRRYPLRLLGSLRAVLGRLAGALGLHAAVHLLGNQDAARIGDPLQPDSNVDPVAVEITVLPNDNVTKVEPDA